MRLFIATELPDAVVSSLSEMRDALAGDDPSVRWVENQSLHLTLKFLGETPEDRIPGIEGRLERIEAGPFSVDLCGVGFFPNDRAPRVFWAGVRSDGLVALAKVVDGCMMECGFSAESREFSPHLTLARSRRSGRIDRQFVDRARPFRNRGFGRFETDRFFLFESRLKPSGAVYVRRREYELNT